MSIVGDLIVKLIGLALIAGMVCFGYALLGEPNRLELKHYTLCLKNADALEGMRIAVMSDIHVGAPFIKKDKLVKIVNAINAEKPDLALIPGDFMATGVIGWHHVSPSILAQMLTQIRAPLGAYGTLGNHDWDYGAWEVQQAFNRYHFPLVENASRTLIYKGNTFHLVGVSDETTKHDNISKALADVPAGEPTILFTHSPDLFPKLKRKVTLGIAGHTHGGQVTLPGYGAIVLNTRTGKRYEQGFKEGRYFITSGIGTSVLPLRFGRPPEISMLTLSCAR